MSDEIFARRSQERPLTCDFAPLLSEPPHAGQQLEKGPTLKLQPSSKLARMKSFGIFPPAVKLPRCKM